ncbi:helix-hairpin-helix domain-containing protein [Candidatus Enterococcus mansonii]|uniref:Helix-hairpin-helix DNA-binding motif class 1 domain-containing protein n=1 Tax=Candidatus Enterococcus mansonii TaxID=1834181 RepID=A0A242CK37_9ENTE|nr:helix-hairpin-helix domain-containing protein [Enterococcus sp. 4G2_DIV0659]OTO10280.1 hypothetical protein A5880_000964 [Enterococcus sp. 4G2_DIV0659]
MDYQAFIQKYRYFILLGCAIVILFICAVVSFMFFKPDHSTDEDFAISSTTASYTSQSESQPNEIYVDIKGAVKKPGMYEGTGNMRVWDAIMLAGGVREDADTKQVNFSKRISDQMVIYVPLIGEVISDDQKPADSQDKSSKDTEKININQANESELQALPGVGQKKAQEIIRYREENGGFKGIEEIKNISGFGDKTFEKLKDVISS